MWLQRWGLGFRVSCLEVYAEEGFLKVWHEELAAGESTSAMGT